jgi:hypothetical protein
MTTATLTLEPRPLFDLRLLARGHDLKAHRVRPKRPFEFIDACGFDAQSKLELTRIWSGAEHK